MTEKWKEIIRVASGEVGYDYQAVKTAIPEGVDFSEVAGGFLEVACPLSQNNVVWDNIHREKAVRTFLEGAIIAVDNRNKPVDPDYWHTTGHDGMEEVFLVGGLMAELLTGGGERVGGMIEIMTKKLRHKDFKNWTVDEIMEKYGLLISNLSLSHPEIVNPGGKLNIAMTKLGYRPCEAGYTKEDCV